MYADLLFVFKITYLVTQASFLPKIDVKALRLILRQHQGTSTNGVQK